MMLRLTRRSALLGLGAAVSLGPVSLAVAAGATDRRFVVVLLRGALDGLAAVVPYGDPAIAAQRGALLPPPPGAADGLLDLGGFYGLHPALAGLHAMYRDGEALPVHAVAGPYRSRSHFEAQDCMESGADHRLPSGWLNRAVAALPPSPRSASAGASPGGSALAIGVSVPLLLRGPATVANWAPQSFAPPQADLYARIAALHAGDRLTGPALATGLRERGFAAAALAEPASAGAPGTTEPPASARPGQRAAFPALAGVAGQMLRAADGPRIAALEIGGWDTHSDQNARLAPPLRQLDAGLVALKQGLGEAWRQTAVLVITEFGRTVRTNGTKGTDHGTASVALLLGGAVAGGRVLADWPGLADGKLLDGRDLQPTADVRALAKGVLAAHLGLRGAALAAVFPGSDQVAPGTRLLRA